MTQRRYIDYGAEAIASGIKNILASFITPGILSGGNFIANAADRLLIEPFSVIQHNGIIIDESEAQYLTIPNTTPAMNYTVVYSHTDQDVIGGEPALLELFSGIQTIETVTDGIILGWVIYPGGSIPLNSNMFIMQRPIHLSNNLTYFDNPAWLPPLTNYLLQTSVSGSPLTISTQYNNTEYYTSTSWYNATGSIGSVSYVLPFRNNDRQITKIVTRLRAPTDTICDIKVIDTDGTILTPLNAIYTGDGAFQTRAVTIQSIANRLLPNTISHIQFSLTINPSRTIDIQSIAVTSQNLPY